MAIGVGTILQFVLGVVLIATGNYVAGGMMIAGALFSAAAVMMAPETKRGNESKSPSYGFGSYQNPAKGGTIQVTYSYRGHKVAPTWTQAFITPKSLQDDDDDFGRVVSERGQALSGLMVVGEGPVIAIENIKFNGENAFTKWEDVAPAESPNGSRKKFTFPHKRVRIDGFVVSLNGTALGWIFGRTSIKVGRGDGIKSVWKMVLPSDLVAEYEIRFYTRDPTSSTQFQQYELVPGNNLGILPRAWLVGAKTLYVNTQVPYPANTDLWISFGARKTQGVSFAKNSDGKVEVTFTTAPPTAAKITATYEVANFPGLTIHKRLGTAGQLNIPGFDLIRNSYGISTELTSSAVSKDTVAEVDDVWFNIVSDAAGMTRYDDEGGHHDIAAQFTIEIKRKTSSGTNSFNSYVQIPDPGGARNTNSSYVPNKSAQEHEVWGDTLAMKAWAFSVKGLIDRLVERNPGNSLYQKWQSDFIRAKYTFRLKRVNAIKAETNNLFSDRVFLSDYVEILNLFLNYPNSVLLAFHALGTAKLNGNAPNVTCEVRGLAEVQHFTGTGVWVEDVASQSNPIWAAVDYITNKRYGHGTLYTKAANIDTASAKIVADWHDELISRGGGSTDTEARARLDINLDVQRGCMETVQQILMPHRAWAVLHGNVWYFFKDDKVTLSACTVVNDYADPTTPTAKRTLVLEHETVAAKPTDVRVKFYDETADWNEQEVQATIESLASEPRQTFTFDARGITRQSEAIRLAVFLFIQLRNGGKKAVIGLNPAAWDCFVADVIRLKSSRIGLDSYMRLFKMDSNSKDFYVRAELAEYVPDAYEFNPAGVLISVSIQSPTVALGAPASAPVYTPPSPPPMGSRSN